MVKSKFSISLHILTLLAYYPNQWCSSTVLARSLNINPVLVRREIKTLKGGGLLESKEGKNGGVKLGKAAKTITLADIFETVKGDDHVLNLSNNTPDVGCKIGSKINAKLITIFSDIDNAIIDSLAGQTLEEFKNKF